MDPRTLDIAAFLAALCIVIAIVFLMNPPFGGDASLSPEDGAASVQQGAVPPDDTSAGEVLQYRLPSYLSKDEKRWLISRQISEGMDYYLPSTRNYAVSYIPTEHSGVFSVEQACDIWEGTRSDWTYSPGDGGLLDINSASMSINTGLTGDKADYAVFLASMIKGAGGEARIKTGTDPEAGQFAYTELYLGNNRDFDTKIINPEKYQEFKKKYSAIFAEDPSGLTIFRYRYGRLCSGNTCYDFVDPFLQIMNEPEKYGELCYNYPKLINYLLLFPDTNVIEFQALYIQTRYGGYDDDQKKIRDISNLRYSYDIEDNGEITYWLPLSLRGSYPGDSVFKGTGSAMVYYSDGSYKSVKVNEKAAPAVYL